MIDKRYWIGFDRIRGIGSVRTKKLLDFFGDLSDAWCAERSALKEAGLPDKIIAEFIKIRREIDLDKEWGHINDLGISVLTSIEADYPQLLRAIAHPPPVLYVKGEIRREDIYSIAVVGTRRKTTYGKQATAELSSFLAANGITVVSGMARGIDTIAHQAALDGGGRTIAVFGCGIDVIYPPENRGLASQIERNGALVSEFYPGTQPEGINFPPRNRIISGLSKAVVVVEADERSGALITAKFAVEQSRDVFAIPGSIFAPSSRGTNRLISDGAFPLLDHKELLLALNMEQSSDYRYVQKTLPENDIELQLMDVMKNEPLHIDEITSLTGLSTEKVSGCLTMMELKGLIRKTGNMTYQSICDESAEYEV